VVRRRPLSPVRGYRGREFEDIRRGGGGFVVVARPEPGRIDVAAIVVRLARLLAVGGDSRLEINDRSDGRATTSAAPDVARVVARSVLTAVGTGERAACEIAVDDDGIFLRVTGATRVSPLPDSELIAAALEQGIRIASGERSIELRFPAVD
jgi:hypothetical protein